MKNVRSKQFVDRDLMSQFEPNIRFSLLETSQELKYPFKIRLMKLKLISAVLVGFFLDTSLGPRRGKQQHAAPLLGVFFFFFQTHLE